MRRIHGEKERLIERTLLEIYNIDSIGVFYHGLKLDVEIIAQPLQVRQRTYPDETIRGSALRRRCHNLAPLVSPDMQLKRVDQS
jgi:hypothetical protein